MKITEKALLDGYQGVSNGATKISVVKGRRIWWEYRRREDGYTPVCAREYADRITLENDRHGVIVGPFPRWDRHPAVRKIEEDQAKLFGSQV